MKEQPIARRLAAESKRSWLNITGASRAIKQLASSVEAHEVSGHHDSSSWWFNLAEEVKAGRHSNEAKSAQLVVRFPFLASYRRPQ